MYKIYVVNNFNSNVNCIPPYINCERNCFRCVIAHSLTNANLFVDGDGECAVFIIYVREPLALTKTH
jgi:hypothetical protein